VRRADVDARGGIDPTLEVFDAARRSAASPAAPPNSASLSMSRPGSIFRMYRRMSMSFGRNPNSHARMRYRGVSARITANGTQNQKYAEWKRKWSLPNTGVEIHPGDMRE
jgi:hypothetical protein